MRDDEFSSASLRKLQLPATFAPTAATAVPTASTVQQPTTSNSLTDAVDTLYDPGYAVQYGDTCEKLYAASGLALQTLEVSYDYEMTLSSQQPVPPGYTLLSYWTPALEWGTLWTVAQELGLHGCEFKDNEAYQSPIRPSVIVSLSSLQTDRLDATVDGAACQYLSSDAGDCYPMVGSMSAKFVGDNSTLAAVQSYLLGIIAAQMNQDLVLTGAVESTFYIGDRPDVPVTGPPTLAPSPIPTAVQPIPSPILPSPSVISSTNSSNPTAILASSLSVAGAIVLLAVFALVVGSKRKRRSADRKMSIISEVDELEHVETGSSRHSTESHGDESKSPLPSPTNSTPWTLPDLLADTRADADRSVLTDGSVASGEAVTVLSGGEVTVTSGGEATVVSGSSGDSDKAVGENMDVQGGSDDKTLELPPKPPQGPSKQPPPVQQTLAKRRRKMKKKKKKNQGMIPHVSSRENIKAMETITEDNGEEADEGSEDEDCSDSEYSYETDESGSRSRDPSPIRSDGGSSELYPPAV